MTATPHPSYSNPTIREVICELHFQLEDGVNWKSSWYSEFFKQIEGQFPVFQPATVPIFLEVTPHLPGPSALAVPQVMRYQHANRNALLQLSDTRIVVNVLPVYPGWAQVGEDIRYAWNNLCKVVTPASITRIGLRYINGIERSASEERLDKWIVQNEYTPVAILRSLPGSSAQTTVILDDLNRIQITLGYQQSPVNPYGTFILDIDRIMEDKIDTNVDLVLRNVTKLHGDVWEVFQSAKSSNLERLLQGKLL